MLQIPDEIKELLHRDSCQKNIRIHFPYGERSDICNNLIVKDSVSFTESLCSQNTFKFGLCEFSTFECETVGVGNIKGATIEVNCEIYCDSSVSGAIWQNDLMAYVYQIPYGLFIVQDAKRQADMIHRKIIAYGGNYGLDNGKSGLIEDAKTGYKTTTGRTYTPKTFYYALANINPRGYPSEMFSATEVTPIADDVNVSRAGSSWYYNGEITEAAITVTRHNWNFQYGDLLELDNLFCMEMDRDLNAFKKQIDECIYVLNNYDCPGNIINNVVESLYNMHRIYMEWYKSDCSNYQNRVFFRESLNNPVFPGVFYPYDSTTTRFAIRVPYKFTFQILMNNDAVYQKDYDEHVKNVSLKQLALEPEYSFLSSYTLSLPWEKDFNLDRSSYMGNVTAIKSFVELCGLFATLDREKKFAVINILRNFGLNPSSTLYPNSNLYPQGVTGGKLLPQDYQSCWYEDNYTLPYGAIQCAYTDSNNDKYLYIYYLTGYDSNTDIATYKVYDFSDNEIIKNNTWDETDIDGFCQQIAANIEGVTYMPVEFVGRGLPYVEAGDTFEILTASNDSITTIVLNRTVSGEQVLTDSYKSVS